MKMQIAINPRLRISPFVMVLLTLMGIAFVVAMIRYIFGIGAISNLSYSYPWGFWISFDLFTGVAIGSGAFVMAATVYIFELKEFQPLLKPSVLDRFPRLHHGRDCAAGRPGPSRAHLVHDDPLERYFGVCWRSACA